MPSYIFNEPFSRMCLIRISQPSISSFAMPFSFLASFSLLFGLKNMTRLISLSSCWTLIHLTLQCFYKGIAVLSYWFQEASFPSVFSVFEMTTWTGWSGHDATTVCQPKNKGVALARRAAVQNEDGWVQGK